jgi:hypothetical protein
MTDAIGRHGLAAFLLDLELECARLEDPTCTTPARLATLHRRERDVRQVRAALYETMKEAPHG